MKTIRTVATHFAAAFSVAMATFAFATGAVQAAEPTTLLYVSNPYPNFASGISAPGKVTAFDPAANGSSTPLLTLNQPSGAWSLTLDSADRLYSLYFLADTPIHVYNPNASGNDAPILIAHGGSYGGTGVSDATGIAVDSQGYVYIVAGQNAGFGPFIEAFAPNATAPFAVIPLAESESGITVDANDNVIVNDGAALKVFAPRLQGGAPIRSLTSAYASGNSVTYSKLTNKIYVASGNRVSVFEGNASGNTPPVRTIIGPATGIGSFIASVAVHPLTGEIYVLSRNAGDAYTVPGVITVYPQLANGNVAPIRTITDAVSQFRSSLSLAFSPPISSSIAINTGGAAFGNFVADNSFTGGGVVSWTNPVNTSLLSGVVPPQNVLQNDREGNFTYKLHGLVAFASYNVTLYFVENYFTAPHKRVFNLTINGALSLKNFDVFAEAGARYKAIQRSFTATASENGEILLKFNASVDQAKVGAITLQLL